MEIYVKAKKMTLNFEIASENLSVTAKYTIEYELSYKLNHSKGEFNALSAYKMDL